MSEYYREGARLMLRALVAAGWHRACPDAVPTVQYKASATVGTKDETGTAGPMATVHTDPAPTRGGAIGPLPFEARDMTVFRRAVWNLPDGGRYEGSWIEEGDNGSGPD